MTRILSLATLLLLVGPAGPAGAHDRSAVPDAPEDIVPLLVGADVPSVPVTLPGEGSVLLDEYVAGTPSVLVFFRGGW